MLRFVHLPNVIVNAEPNECVVSGSWLFMLAFSQIKWYFTDIFIDSWMAEDVLNFCTKKAVNTAFLLLLYKWEVVNNLGYKRVPSNNSWIFCGRYKQLLKFVSKKFPFVLLVPTAQNLQNLSWDWRRRHNGRETVIRETQFLWDKNGRSWSVSWKLNWHEIGNPTSN